MHRFKIQIVGIIVEVRSLYDYTYDACREYCISSPWTDFSVYVNREQILDKIRQFTVPLPPEMAECICLHEKIALQLWRYDAFVLHGCLFSCDARNYAIVAPRGVGKTTHAHLWRQKYGNHVRIINGDKPIVRRLSDGCFYAYGTPWCGKEGENSNQGVLLHALCLLSRGEENRVLAPDAEQYVRLLIGQVVFPDSEIATTRGAALIADFVRKVPAVQAACNQTVSAAEAVRFAFERIERK